MLADPEQIKRAQRGDDNAFKTYLVAGKVNSAGKPVRYPPSKPALRRSFQTGANSQYDTCIPSPTTQYSKTAMNARFDQPIQP
jgi:hypothetical protein